jgi:hypothetical protein
MAGSTIAAALTGERTIQSSSLATVTTHSVVLRNAEDRCEVVLSLAQLSGLKTAQVSYLGFLVIACALLILSAAALISPQGNGAGIPLAVCAAIFVVMYRVSRRAAVIFLTGTDEIQTPFGSLRDAAALVKAVCEAQSFVDEPENDSQQAAQCAG